MRLLAKRSQRLRIVYFESEIFEYDGNKWELKLSGNPPDAQSPTALHPGVYEMARPPF